MTFTGVVKASYGNDSIALIQWLSEQALNYPSERRTNIAVLYNDTGWASDEWPEWPERVERGEALARACGFSPYRTISMGLEALVRKKKSWPRQGIQFCTQQLKMEPTEAWLDIHDPEKLSVSIIGVRREESSNRANHPEWSVGLDGRKVWAPLCAMLETERDHYIHRAGFDVLPHRSKECFPCINSNRADILDLANHPGRIDKINDIEISMGFTSKGAPRTMFRPYRYMGATGINEIVRWAKAGRGKFNLDDGNGSSGCESGWCGS